MLQPAIRCAPTESEGQLPNRPAYSPAQRVGRSLLAANQPRGTARPSMFALERDAQGLAARLSTANEQYRPSIPPFLRFIQREAPDFRGSPQAFRSYGGDLCGPHVI